MTLRFKTFLVLLVALLLAIPTGAMAKGKPDGAGNGNGHGKPAWAGQGGKPDKAEKAKGHEKAKAAHEKKAKKDMQTFGAAEDEDGDENDPDDLSLEDLEALEGMHAPGQYCHALETFQESLAEMWGGDSFDERFGENDNLANSHGKCASWRAQGGSLDEEAEASADEEASDEDQASEETDDDPCEAAEEEGAETDEASDEAADEECESEEPAGDAQADEDGDEDEGAEEPEPDEDDSFMATFELGRLTF
jgi:hypothetical protein